MSDITVNSGGPVEVDPVTLRTAAAQLDGVQAEVVVAQRQFLAADDILAGICMTVTTDSSAVLLQHTSLLVSRVGSRAESLRAAADLYEASELLRAQQLGELSAADRVRLTELGTLRPGVLAEAQRRAREWRTSVHDVLLAQAATTSGQGLVHRLMGRFVAEVARCDFGRRSLGPVTGPLPKVDVEERVRKDGGSAPDGYEALMDRIPDGTSQVRVERYMMPDGERTFVLYVDGTRRPFTAEEPWNWESNTDLYLDDTASASYAVTLEALRQAGARPGDDLITVGYSQGGMISEIVAQDPRFDTPMSVSFGSPQEAEVRDSTQHIAVRHADDIVANLTNGGIGGRNGSIDSAVVERVYHPELTTFGEFGIAPHQRDAYLDTARQMDLSDDPRLLAGREQLERLLAAERVTVFEYTGTVPADG